MAYLPISIASPCSDLTREIFLWHKASWSILFTMKQRWQALGYWATALYCSKKCCHVHTVSSSTLLWWSYSGFQSCFDNYHKNLSKHLKTLQSNGCFWLHCSFEYGIWKHQACLPFSLTSRNLLLTYFFSSKSSLYNFNNFSLKVQNYNSMPSN